jgi:ArsR family transcriptional regulator
MLELTKVLKVLADKNRIRIVKLLEKKPMCVCELAFILGITQPSTSRHLKKLKAAGLVGDEQEGFWTNYFLTKSDTPYAKALMLRIRGWINDDPVITNDIEKSGKVNRLKLCCRK